MKRSCIKKIKRIIKSNSEGRYLRGEQINRCKRYCREHYGGYDDALWHIACYKINGIFSLNYIPEHFFYNELEKYLNPDKYVACYLDKGKYDFIFKTINRPQTILRKIRGNYFDCRFERCTPEGLFHQSQEVTEVVIKPSFDSHGGRGIEVIKSNELSEYLKNDYSENLLIQEYVKQHSEMAKFNMGSLNTIRICTLNLYGVPKVYSAVLRMGREGNRVDNLSKGGLSVGIRKDGSLNRYAHNIFFNERHEKHPDSGITFLGQKIPCWHKIKNTTAYLHKRIPELGILSWDMSLDVDCNPVLIEVNPNNQGINMHQFNNGPLFGDDTEKVLNWYNRKNLSTKFKGI